jgi:hypothetical protein
VERRGWVIRAATIMGQLETGEARRFRWRAAALRDGTSRVMGHLQARICEGVKFPGPTRQIDDRGERYSCVDFSILGVADIYRVFSTGSCAAGLPCCGEQGHLGAEIASDVKEL